MKLSTSVQIHHPVLHRPRSNSVLQYRPTTQYYTDPDQTQYFSTDPPPSTTQTQMKLSTSVQIHHPVLHRPRSNSVLQYRPTTQYYTDPDQTQYFSTDPPPSTTQTQIKLSTSVQTPHPVLHRPISNSVLQYRPIPSTTQTQIKLSTSVQTYPQYYTHPDQTQYFSTDLPPVLHTPRSNSVLQYRPIPSTTQTQIKLSTSVQTHPQYNTDPDQAQYFSTDPSLVLHPPRSNSVFQYRPIPSTTQTQIKLSTSVQTHPQYYTDPDQTQYFSTDPSPVLHIPRSNSVLQYRPIPSTTQTQIKLSTSVQTHPQYYTDPDQTQYFSTDPSPVLHRPRSNSVLQYRPIPSTTQAQIKLSTSVQTHPQYYTHPDQTQYFSTDPSPLLHTPRSN